MTDKILEEGKTNVTAFDFISNYDFTSTTPRIIVEVETKGETNSLVLNKDAILNYLTLINRWIKTETLLIEALRNQIRKSNFYELSQELEEGDITENEFDEELERNVNKYVVSLKSMNSPFDAFIVDSLVNKIGSDLKEFSVNEIAEMFSIKKDQLIANLNQFGYLLK